MQKLKFVKDTRKEQIVEALLTGQKMIIIDNVEIILNPLKRDTHKRKEAEAKVVAEQILKLL